MIARDPVCGMEVKVQTAESKFEYKGKTYYFCTPLCMLTFQNNLEEYLKGRDTETEK